MRPIRSLFGLMLLAGAVVCFLRAMERSRIEFGRSSAPARPDEPGWYEPITAKTVEERKPPIPNPPAPTGDGKAPRPDWVGKPPHLESPNGPDSPEIYVATATAGPYSTPEECDRALGGEIDRVVTDFAEKQFQPMPDQPVKLDRAFVQNHLIQARYRETVDSPSVGPMQQEHVLLVFDNQARAAIEQAWRSIIVDQRLKYAAAGSGALLLVLGGVYSLLKLKPRT
jgi:hypothetical protein